VLEECLQQNMPEVPFRLNAVAAAARPTDAAGCGQQRLQNRSWADPGQQMVQEDTQEEGAPADHDAALAMQAVIKEEDGEDDRGTQTDRQAGSRNSSSGAGSFSRSNMAGSSSSSSRNRGMTPIVLQARRPAA
jgi:hypothetical protein